MKKIAKKGTKKPAGEVDPRFVPVVNSFAEIRDVSAGRLMASYGLRVNGKIFAMFGRGKFVAKLPKERVDGLVSSGHAERFDPGHGRLMKEWVALEAGSENWIDLAKEAYQFVKLGKR